MTSTDQGLILLDYFDVVQSSGDGKGEVRRWEVTRAAESLTDPKGLRLRDDGEGLPGIVFPHLRPVEITVDDAAGSISLSAPGISATSESNQAYHNQFDVLIVKASDFDPGAFFIGNSLNPSVLGNTATKLCTIEPRKNGSFSYQGPFNAEGHVKLLLVGSSAPV